MPDQLSAADVLCRRCGHPHGPDEHDTPQQALLRRLAIGLDIPVQFLGLDMRLPIPLPPPSRRQRVARHVGQAGWRIGYTVSQAGRLLEHAGDRLIDAGDWIAARVAGR